MSSFTRVKCWMETWFAHWWCQKWKEERERKSDMHEFLAMTVTIIVGRSLPLSWSHPTLFMPQNDIKHLRVANSYSHSPKYQIKTRVTTRWRKDARGFESKTRSISILVDLLTSCLLYYGQNTSNGKKPRSSCGNGFSGHNGKTTFLLLVTKEGSAIPDMHWRRIKTANICVRFVRVPLRRRMRVVIW